MSFNTANTASGEAAIDWLRSTWYVAGRVAAMESIATIHRVMMTKSESAIFFSMGDLLAPGKILPSVPREHGRPHERVPTRSRARK
jgi:hypothetical protein